MYIEEWLHQKLLREQAEWKETVKRFPSIPFRTVSSERFIKVDQEFSAYLMPITKIIEANSVKDIQQAVDTHILLALL